jgi:uncharacterized membrane protein
MQIRNRLVFYFARLRERLWIKPLLVALASVVVALATKSLDTAEFAALLPEIRRDTVETLLDIMAASMLVIATLSVASMVSAYASASNSATPRSFPLILSDDLSQNALSVFVGAFIFSIVSLIAVKNDYYAQAGIAVVFMVTLLVFTVVILTFVRWVDRIARLGRIGHTVDKVEDAASRALRQRSENPTLGARPLDDDRDIGRPVFGEKVGYVQHIKLELLQEYAEEFDCDVRIASLPGTFSAPGAPLAHVTLPDGDEIHAERIHAAFIIGGSRTFEDDPRFGLIVLSEIASRALSSAVNDPGTAIDIVGTFVRLFNQWAQPADEAQCRFDRVFVPALSIDDMFEDAFTGIARDGAGSVEVCVRLQKAFTALAAMGDEPMAKAARHHSQLALSRAERALPLPHDIAAVRAAALAAPSTSTT